VLAVGRLKGANPLAELDELLQELFLGFCPVVSVSRRVRANTRMLSFRARPIGRHAHYCISLKPLKTVFGFLSYDMRYSGAVQRKLVNHHKGLAAAIIVFGVSAVYPVARQYNVRN